MALNNKPGDFFSFSNIFLVDNIFRSSWLFMICALFIFSLMASFILSECSILPFLMLCKTALCNSIKTSLIPPVKTFEEIGVNYIRQLIPAI